jgi:L-asparaginase
MAAKARIAHLAGPNATIQNTPPLVTSNKARAKYGLPAAQGKYDVLRAQRLAARAVVYVEQFSAHPLESDSAPLYGPPDGFLDADGRFSKERRDPSDKPVYEVELKPEDGLYPLPYMARQADGRAWEDDVAYAGAPDQAARQTFFPDGARSFEEIDRLHVGKTGRGNHISSMAEIEFFRVLPPGGYRNAREGQAAEARGTDFFPYRPHHLHAAPPRSRLARATNAVQKILASGKYDGAIWTEGSPSVEETLYWLNLLVDTTVPLCGNSAQRPHGMMSNDGPKNIVDSVEYITSRVWADEQGRNRAGFVLIQEQRVFAARSVAKLDARPGGYGATGGHGGILGAAGHDGLPLLQYLPTAKHSYLSEVNVTRLPKETTGVRRAGDRIETVRVPVKGGNGELLESAIPSVSIIKDGGYADDDDRDDLSRHVDIHALMKDKLEHAPLAGFISEGWVPYGTLSSAARNELLARAAYSGLPVVRVGRGNTEGYVPNRAPFIGGSNLTSTKARLLLMACLMKLGSLPVAADPARPTAQEMAALEKKVAEYQAVFNTH